VFNYNLEANARMHFTTTLTFSFKIFYPLHSCVILQLLQQQTQFIKW